MSKVSFRGFNSSDKGKFLELMEDTFAYSRFVDNQELRNQQYLFMLSKYLSEATFSRVALIDGRVVGIAFCRTHGAPRIRSTLRMHFVKKRENNKLWRMIEEKDPKVGDQILEMDRVNKSLFNAAGEVDGYIQFLAVSDDAKGLGLGRTMVEEMISHMKMYNAHSVIAFTDDQCDSGFFEHMGFVLSGTEKAALNHGVETITLHSFSYLLKL